MKPKRGRKKALNNDEIEFAQYLRENGLGYRAIADAFGVSRMAVWRSISGGGA